MLVSPMSKCFRPLLGFRWIENGQKLLGSMGRHKAKETHPILTNLYGLIEAMIEHLNGQSVYLSNSRRTSVYRCKVSSIVSAFLLME